MGISDLTAVAARRAAMTGERAELERRRAELLTEDQELELTERVLNRLAEMYAPPRSLSQAREESSETFLVVPSHDPAILDVLQALVGRGLAAGRERWSVLRAIVERRFEAALRRPH